MRITAFGAVPAAAKALVSAAGSGVSNYIVKPFNAQTLKTKIELVFEPAEEAPAA